uniref:Uncharacterized protein AlNc14C82G5330 n=1 Tax=Albugo laibachii Nc14 TaxID=890382 RepID=F0WFE0_9STRA|nr:conserved hypothetical protein [Albugo laibachii Nc14]|eukprot:CCA19922.1 conserved hypothetical protein [Albugo laibachii Nc14]
MIDDVDTVQSVFGHQDSCVRDTIECLSKDEEESALIYALVHDPEFRLALAILKTPAEDTKYDTIVKALIRVFKPCKRKFYNLVRALMVQEMVETQNWNDLFRSKSAVTALVREYTFQIGKEFLHEALQRTMEELQKNQDRTYEVNPHRLVNLVRSEAKEKATNRRYLEQLLVHNRKKMHSIAQGTLDRISEVTKVFPASIAILYTILKQEMIRILIEEKDTDAMAAYTHKDEGGRPRSLSIDQPERVSFSNQKFSCPDTTGDHAKISEEEATDEIMIHLGGFFFLRFICPALLMPQKFELTRNGSRPTGAMQRNLMLLAKLFQSLSSAVEYGTHEAYMTPFNGFLSANRSTLARLYTNLFDIGTNDKAFDDGSEETVENVDSEYEQTQNISITTIREILLRKLDVIASHVEREHMKLEEQRKRAAGTSVASIVGQRQNRLKLEQSESSQDETEISEREEKSLPSSTELRDFDVKDLERLLHKQKSFEIKMKASFRPSREGLGSLLTVNDPGRSRRWKRFKHARSNAQVFRRHPPSQDFVEFKASIEIKASSRLVFRYLRSLESISEWDERASHIEKIEPISSSSILLYRSHPKLSLWPSWLVKPKNSYDLHTFISQTGRPRTHAVIMESITNSEVSECNNETQKSCASGGFLIEPFTGLLSEEGVAPKYKIPSSELCECVDLDEIIERYSGEPCQMDSRATKASTFSSPEQQYQPEIDNLPVTRLTCVVRSDFKGSMPRSFAEVVCYRQVLSVEPICKHVEAEVAHLRSQWV